MPENSEKPKQRKRTLLLPYSVFLILLLSVFLMVQSRNEESIENSLNLEPPVWEYSHEGGGASVTGGYVYRGELIPALYGRYIYGDYITGQVWALSLENGTIDNDLLYDSKSNTSVEGTGRLAIAAFGVDESEELYIVDRSSGIYRFNLTPAGDVVIENAFAGVNFLNSVGLATASDGSKRLFVVEQSGVIKAVELASGEISEFLNISAKIFDDDREQGLLGLAFHPNFVNNSQFFITYTFPNDGDLRLSRFTANLDPNATLQTEKILLEVEQPYRNHNGGHIDFGPNGYLYLGLGDGGKWHDFYNNAQNLKTLKGSLLRLDVDHPGSGLPYGIPPDNPFVGNNNETREEIYAYGFRNPWTFSFDSQTGELWLADVGQDQWEEINIVTAGQNYGWAFMEGNRCYESPYSHYDGYGCEGTDAWSIGVYLWERVLLNVPLMAFLIVTLILAHRIRY